MPNASPKRQEHEKEERKQEGTFYTTKPTVGRR